MLVVGEGYGVGVGWPWQWRETQGDGRRNKDDNKAFKVSSNVPPDIDLSLGHSSDSYWSSEYRPFSVFLITALQLPP